MFHKCLSSLFAFFFLFNLTSSASANGQSSTYTVESDGLERTYKIYRPSVPFSMILPVMIVLHGGLGNAEHIETSSEMNLVADTGPFIAVYPNGTGGIRKRIEDKRTWNAGNCCGLAVKKTIDDVKFIQKMIEDIALRYSIDRTRIYVTGISNGAMMAYRLACEIPERLAAIVPISGTMAIDSCEKGKDVPVMHIHGELDDNVPYSGGSGRRSVAGVPHRSIPETVQLMTEPRECRPPEMTYHDNRTTSSYRCAKGAPFFLVLLKNTGHTWPGGRQEKINSKGDKYLASEQAWKFAKQFSKIPQ